MLPDVPTVAEQVLPGLRGDRLVRHAGAGRNAGGGGRAAQPEVNAVLTQTDVKERLQALGVEAGGGARRGLRRADRARPKRYGDAIRRLGIKAE